MNVEPIDHDPPTLRRGPRVLLRVLLAEDDDEMRSLLAGAIRLDGHEVIEARDGRELIARLETSLDGARPYDLVVSDMLMPGVTGFTVLSRLASEASSPQLVVITAFGSEELHAWARAIGAVATFDKPFDVDDLRTVLLNLPAREARHGGC